MSTLEQEVRAAREAGLSYGQYVARRYNGQIPLAPRPEPPKRFRVKRYSDELAFQLWQQGKTDGEIAGVFGVSRTIIQRWRDTLELPSTVLFPWIDTSRYRLVLQGKDYIVLPPEYLYKLIRRGCEVWAVQIRVQPGIFRKGI